MLAQRRHTTTVTLNHDKTSHPLNLDTQKSNLAQFTLRHNPNNPRAASIFWRILAFLLSSPVILMGIHISLRRL